MNMSEFEFLGRNLGRTQQVPGYAEGFGAKSSHLVWNDGLIDDTLLF